MAGEGDPSSFIHISLGVPGSIALIAALILLNALFAMAEFALVSVRKTRIRQLVDEGVKAAKDVQSLIEQPARYLATIQIGVTFVQFFASAAGAVTLASPFASVLQKTNIAIIHDNSQTISVFIVTIVIGYISLVMGEITPKSIGLHFAEKIALFSAKPVLVLSIITRPLVRLITWTGNLVMKPLGVSASFSQPIITEEELKMLVQAGEEDGILEEEEKEMIHSIFEFTDTVVRKVMIPRIDIRAVEVDSSLEELLDVIISAGHSRVPVFDDTIDNIVGVIHAKDLLKILHDNSRNMPLRDLMRPPYVIPENKMVDELLAEFKKSKIQMAIVVDEYGGTAGLVTIEDLLEEIVGDIMDEYDIEEPPVMVIDENTSVFDARTPIDDINDQMDVNLPDEEFDTIGGFVFGLFGREVHEGDTTSFGTVDFIVEQTDGHRIQQIRVVNRTDSVIEDDEENT